jgi:hypothetical protein
MAAAGLLFLALAASYRWVERPKTKDKMLKPQIDSDQEADALCKECGLAFQL